MKYRIIEERLYNKFGDNYETNFKVKEQTSFLGIKSWEYLHHRYNSMSGNYNVPWEYDTIKEIESKLDDYIESQLKLQKTTSVKIEREIIKEITL